MEFGVVAEGFLRDTCRSSLWDPEELMYLFSSVKKRVEDGISLRGRVGDSLFGLDGPR